MCRYTNGCVNKLSSFAVGKSERRKRLDGGCDIDFQEIFQVETIGETRR